jgi:hypothetical protein
MKENKLNKFVLLMLCFPVVAGWQKVELKELLTAQKADLEAQTASTTAIMALDLSPYTILEKVSSSVLKLKTVEVDTELWLENSLFHIKSDFKNRIKNVDDYKTDGRVSFSLLLPDGFSSSQWVQNYEIGGIPFTWNRQKREWEKKELEITGKDSQAVLSYSVLRSLFTINKDEVDPSTVKILGVENRKGKDCFILGYSLDPEMFKRWNLVGNISMKLWIDKADFLPQMMRAEGKIGEMYLLQVVNYSNFNRSPEFVLPQVINSQVRAEKDGLKAKVVDLVKEVGQIRGWKPLEEIKVEFSDRVTLRNYLEEELARDYGQDQLDNEAEVLRWLGLLPDKVDYKESLINSQISSLAGLYDPLTKTIFIGEWLHPFLAESVLVHEIAHAYQDRQVSMDKFLGEKPRKENLDFSMARHSLLEGEATAIMLEYLLRKDGADFQGLGDIFSFIEEKIVKNSEYTRQNMQYNIYGYGANFIQHFLKDNKWTEMDKIYNNPPVFMSDILHPYRGSLEKRSLDPAYSERSANDSWLPGDWRKIYSTRLGEFFLLVSLRQFLDKDTAEQATSGWKNDAVSLYDNENNQKLVVLRTRWSNSEGMNFYLQAFKDWLNKRYPKAEAQDKDQGSLIKTPEGSFYLKPGKDELTVVWSQGQSPGEFEFLTQKIPN